MKAAMFNYHPSKLSFRSLFVIALGILAANAKADVFISEYVEGSSLNKAIEIYNGNASDVDLSTYVIQIYSNGSTNPSTTIGLSGILAAGDVYVVADDGADPAILAVVDQTSTASFFNGNDAVVLRDGGSVVDAIGQIGFDPGSQWGVDPVSTQNNTIRRKDSICNGDTDPNDTFDPAIEWDGFASDTFSGLGSHSPTCTVIPPTTVFIHDIQGNGTSSPMVGVNVQIEAIVTADFQNAGQLSGIYVQEEDADADGDASTSEGIFVFTGTSPANVTVGDQVTVMGVVSEYFDLTELTNASVLVNSSGNPLPMITDVNLPFSSLTDLEPYEGMMVRLPQTLTVTENYNLGRYGEFWLSSSGRLMQPTAITTPGMNANNQQTTNDLNRILINDGSTVQNPDPVIYPAPALSASNTLRSGDSVTNLTGVLHYSFGYYNINPIQTPVMTGTNLRTNTPPSLNAPLRVASFNVLNYFNGDGLGGGFPTARGADTLSEFNRQRDKLISAITELRADVIGLMEIENDGYSTTSAIQDLVNGLNSSAPVGTSYDFIDPGVSMIGTDQIAVGLIYREQTVVPVGAAQILDSSVDASFIDTKNRPALAQTFQHTVSHDRLTVAVNHLKSKGSDCVSLGDPDTGDGQGNCNLTRTTAATALVNWLATDPTGSGDADYLIIGDLNSYAMEDPITAIKNAGYSDLLDTFIGATQAYSYIYQGQAGYLDHALSSASLTPQIAGVSLWHTNADEPRALDYNEEFKTAGQIISYYNADPFRSSDHDSVLIGVNLSDPSITKGDGSIVSNLDANVSNQTYVQLSAGTYHVQLLNPMLDGDADFYSWSPDGIYWSTEFDIVDANGTSLLSAGQSCSSSTTEACYQETSPTLFTLDVSEDQLVFIKLADTDLSDNSGGLSLSFSIATSSVSVPFVPAWLLVVFSTLLVVIGRRRLNK